jgi:hypothetical protein
MFGSINYYLAGGGVAASVPFGCATYGTEGTYTFVVPSGVSKISVVCVGSGGGGVACSCGGSSIGGGGGALSYTNCIPVTPGESLTVVAGAKAYQPNLCTYPSANGNDSYVSRGATQLIMAKGGFGDDQAHAPVSGGPAASGIGAVKYSGGNRNSGAGGAAGYAGNGGNGGFPPGVTIAGQAGSGGGGGGGAGAYPGFGGGGGGVGLVVQGASGGATPSSTAPINGGNGGSGGSPAPTPVSSSIANSMNGGNYGGGMGSSGDSCNSSWLPAYSGSGGVRIIYGGTGKSYPNNSAP